jgi:Flp pilus assembly protein TadD
MSETFDLFQQGREHLSKGMAAQATVALEKAKAREPEKASIREALGIAYFRIHRYAELAPVDDYAHYALGRCLEKQGREHEANGQYKLASSLRPGTRVYQARIRDLG